MKINFKNKILNKSSFFRFLQDYKSSNQDLLNKWGDTKYSKEKYNDRHKLGLRKFVRFNYSAILERIVVFIHDYSNILMP